MWRAPKGLKRYAWSKPRTVHIWQLQDTNQLELMVCAHVYIREKVHMKTRLASVAHFKHCPVCVLKNKNALKGN